MSTLNFVDTYDMVAFLAKPAESEGFKQIVDFLNARPIKYALNLQALVDGKKVIITEAIVRRDLQLEDVEGVECLPNVTIFEELTKMGAKTTAWNEFSSTMASAVICLATNQKFNFSKYIFESMVKNLENEGKFLMYPRFIQVFLDKQVEGMQSHKKIYDAPCHTKKIFANMRRQGKDFSGRETPLFQTMMVQAQEGMGKGLEIPTDPHHTPTFIQPLTSQPQRKQKSRRPKRKDTEIPQSSGPTDNVADKAVNEEMDNSLERATTTATGLDAEQDRGNISKTQSEETPNEPSSIGTSSGGGPRRQDTIGDIIAQTRFENVSKTSNDPLLLRGNTLRSGEDSMQLNELMEFCTKLKQRVLDLENTKTAQAQEITSLKKRVKKLERKKKSRTHRLKRLYKIGLSTRIISSDKASLGDQEDASKQGRKIHDIDADKDITLDSTHFDTDHDMFGVHDLDGDEVFVETEEPVVNAATTTSTILVSAAKDLSDVDMTLAQALAELKSTKPKAITTTTTTTTTAVTRPKAKGLVIQEQEQASTPITSSKDKGKGIMVEEPLKIKKKDQVLFDEQEAIMLKAQFNKEERIDKVKTDYELAKRLQAEEQEELTIKEKSKLFQQLLEKRRKHFAAKRVEERRNRPPIRAQQRSIMCTYLKNMAGWKPKDLKNKSFANIQELFDKAMKRVNTFVEMDTELVEGSKVRAEGSETREESSSKRAGDELEQENAKKQKMNDEQETAELQSLIEIVSDEEGIAIDVIPLATKPPSIIDWKILKEGKISYYQIIRADGSSKRYSVIIQMLRSFDKEDLETLWKLVKAMHGSARPEEGYERLSMKKLEILKKNIKFRGGLLGLKVFLMLFEVTTALIDVNASQSKLLLPVEVKTAMVRVTTAKQNTARLMFWVSTKVTTAHGFSCLKRFFCQRIKKEKDKDWLEDQGLQRLKADNTVRVNQIVTIFLIESSIHILDQNRYPVDTRLIRSESRKSPTVELFNVDSGRISIHHCEC
ncbi:hypothetical protein Tco_0151815 [Tanacetum coccineum]